MELKRDGFYKADKGKHFILTEIGKAECASYRNKTVGEPVSEYEDEAVHWAVEEGYLVETDIPGWTTLKGYEVVYYLNNHKLYVGNQQVFPLRKIAEIYKKNFESYSWMKDRKIVIEEVDYEGVPLSESKYFNGKEVIDQEHYFGLDACEIGSYFTEEMVEYFMNVLPPVCWRDDCAQIGEPYTLRIDDNGECKNTYDTFKKISDGIWEYCGDCFKGENVKRGREVSYV